MLTKLLKHEFRATARIMGPLYLVLLAVALGFNFSARLMDSGNFVLNMLAALVVMAYVVAITAVFIVAFILMLQRFYCGGAGQAVRGGAGPQTAGGPQ